MSNGLPVSRLINVSVSLSQTAAQAPNLNSLLILGDSDIIDTSTRIQSYGSLTEVAAAFGTTAPEYKAAALYFGQLPSPMQLYIGRWAAIATSGRLFGGLLSASQRLISNFTAVTTGGFKIQVDGGAVTNITGINLSGAANLNAVAALIQTALTTATIAATVTWDGSRFVFKSNATGATSAVAELQPPTAGVSIVPLINGTIALGARSVNGIVAESLLAAATILDAQPTGWYALSLAATATIADADTLAVAAFIEGTGLKHLFGVTTQLAAAVDPTSTTDIGYLLKAANYQQTAWQYSTSSPYAVASLFARILTTNFDANNSMITLMYKQEPGVTAEQLTTSQADALKAKNGNVFVAYDNSTAIIQYGQVSSGLYIDEVYGASWVKFRVQTDVFNALYTNPYKIPQTDAGMGQLATVIERSCAAAVNNGLVGPGVWTNTGFGQLKTNDFLASGYYVYAPPISLQSQADRAARKSVAFQVALKFAGAVHTVDIAMSINR